MITSDAVVADFEVGLELLEARPGRLELGVGDADVARPSSGAAAVEQRQHVGVAVDVAEVELDAPAEPHPAVAGARQQQDLAVAARRAEHFRLAVLAAALRQRRLCRTTDRL